MREIKFRAWDKENECMVNIGDGDPYIFTVDEFFRPSLLIWNDDVLGSFGHVESAIMQYTGIEDKNGIEIYEGDVVTGGHASDEYAVVVYCQDDCAFKIDTKMWNALIADCPILIIHGNIHENPELLEKEK